MNPELPENPCEKMELRVTALLLGELSAEEASAVREAIAKDPELSKLHADLKETIQLVRTATTSRGEPATEQAAPLQLSGQRRQKLLTAFAIPPLRPVHRKPKSSLRLGLVEWLAVLAIVAILAAALLPAMHSSKSRAQSHYLARKADEKLAEGLSFKTWGQGSEPATAAAPPAPPSQRTREPYSVNVVGYVNVATQGYTLVEGGSKDFGQNKALADAAGKDATTVGRPESVSKDYLREQPPVLTVTAPAITQPQSQIVLPSLNDADADGLSDYGTRQKGRSVDVVARVANGEESARGLDRNGRGQTESAATSVSQKAWTISSALRGFHDDNVNTSGTTKVDTFGVEVSPSIGFELPKDQAATSLESAVNLQRSPIANASSVGDQTHTFDTFKANEFGRGRADGAEGKPGVVAAGVPVAPERFYRFSPGGGLGGGGVGVGGVAVQNGTAAPLAGDGVPVLGDVPTLGKPFVGQTTANRDGTVLADNLSTSDFDAPRPTIAAKPEAWFAAKNSRGDATAAFDAAVPDSGLAKLPTLNPAAEIELNQTLSLGGIVAAEPAMRSVRLAETPVAEDKSGRELSDYSDANYKFYGANAGNFGAFVPPTLSVAGDVAIAATAVPSPATTYLGFGIGEPLVQMPTAAPTASASPPVAEAEVSQRAFMERYGMPSRDRKLVEAPTPAYAIAVDGTQPAKADDDIDALGTVVQAGRAVTPSVTDSETKKGIAAQPSDPARQLNDSVLARGDRGERERTWTPSESVDKVPLLGDLPGIGKLFRSEPSQTLNRNGRLDAPASVVTSNGQTLEFVGYDDPGQFMPQGQLASTDVGGKGVPVRAQLPIPRYRLRPTDPLSKSLASGAIILPPTLGGKVEQQIAQKQNEVEVLRRQAGVSDPEAAGRTAAPAIEGEPLRRYKASLLDAEVKLRAREVISEKLKALDRGELKQVLPRMIQDQQFSELQNQLNRAEQQLVVVRQDNGTTDSETEQLQTKVDDLKKRVDQRVDTLMGDVEKELARGQVELNALKLRVAQSERADVENAKKSRPYYEKKSELEQLYGQLRVLDTKLSAEKIDISIPRNTMVEIIDSALPAREKSGGLRSLGVPIGGSYASIARVRIDRDATDIEGVMGSRAIGYDPYFVQTELEVMQSEAVLGKVVEDLKLDETWAKNSGSATPLNKEVAVKQLRGKLKLHPVDKSSLTEISVKDGDAEEAAKIANAIAKAYQEQRRESRRQLSEGGIAVLEERHREQVDKISKAQKELAELRQQLGISEMDAAGTVVTPTQVTEPDIPAPRIATTNAPIPQPEIQTSENNFSTFSLNVSDVSFKLAAASLEKGQMPDAASVRSEEFINAFDYRDPEPAAGAPIAFTYERARYPFAHNRDLLRFSLKTAAAGRQAGRPLNVVLLLDNSGSMERADRVQIIREALRVLASQLQPQDKLSVITFARTPRLVADGISGDKAGEVAEALSGLTPQGGTNLEDAMNLAYQTAAKHYLANGINRVVLLTDGAANLGNVEPDSLKQKVEAQRQQGIALDAFGIGWEGFNDDLLEVLSRNGDGRYGFINSPEEAATDFAGQLAGALKVAASDVKVQVEFNPKRVTAYRQIGYAKHQLTKEQFRDNTVDAAEIAAQEAGNALYTVEVNPAGEGPLGTVRVRYKIPGTTDYREQAWVVPFVRNSISLEQSTPAMRLAASASAFSEWLVASPFAAEATPDRLLGYLGGVPEVYGADERPKKLEWMIRQAKSLEGK